MVNKLFVALTVPALLAVFLAEKAPVWMERPSEHLGWLLLLWFACGVWFVGGLVLSPAFREQVLTRIAGFRERDEREELVTARAARSVFLMTLGGFIAAGFIGLLQVNFYAYTRWKGDSVPPLVKVGPYQLRKGEVERRAFYMWPSLGIPKDQRRPNFRESTVGNTQYFHERGSMFPPEVSRTFFGLAALQVLLFHLFARRLRA